MSKTVSINQAINWATKLLSTASDTPMLDAKILFRHVSSFSAVDLILKSDELLNNELAEAYRQITSKRRHGVPVAYLTGQKEFWSLTFSVTPDTLIPRPETELLVETVLQYIPKEVECQVADLGTGSGAIACAIAYERPNANVIATDNSSAALKIAAENAKAHQINNVSFIQSDWFENLINRDYDLIVSNPPYIATTDAHLQQGDIKYEPQEALISGEEGLDALSSIIHQAKSYLKQTGWLLVEHGYDQAESVKQLFNGHKYNNISCLSDNNGQPRVCYGQLI